MAALRLHADCGRGGPSESTIKVVAAAVTSFSTEARLERHGHVRYLGQARRAPARNDAVQRPVASGANAAKIKPGGSRATSLPATTCISAVLSPAGALRHAKRPVFLRRSRTTDRSKNTKLDGSARVEMTAAGREEPVRAAKSWSPTCAAATVRHVIDCRATTDLGNVVAGWFERPLMDRTGRVVSCLRSRSVNPDKSSSFFSIFSPRLSLGG